MSPGAPKAAKATPKRVAQLTQTPNLSFRSVPEFVQAVRAVTDPKPLPTRAVQKPAPVVSNVERQRRAAQAAKDKSQKHRLSERGAMVLSRANENMWKSNNVNTWRGVSGRKMKAIQRAHASKLTPDMKRMANFMLENAKEDPLMTMFAMQYANPFAHYGCRFLGPVENSVGVYTMFRTVDIPLNTTNGRFAACLQPKIGNKSTLAEWQLMLVDSAATGWDDGDWTVESNYMVNSPAGDLRVDPNYASIATTQTVMRSFKQSALGVAITAVTDAQYQFDDDDNDFNVTATANSDGVTYSFPVGLPRMVRIWINYGTAQAANTTITPTTTVTGGVTVDTTILNQRLGTTTAGGAQTYAQYEADLNLDGTAGTIRLAFSGGTAATTVLSSVTAEIRPSNTSSLDYGSFSSVQPVAAGIWAEWVGPLIENAGNIVSALGPVNSVNQHWLTTGSSAGQFRPQYWEEYTQLQPGNNQKVYPDGRIDEGAVAMWRPQRPEDQELFRPTVHNTTTYGPMYIAGQYNTSTGTIPSGSIVRLFITITFQYETPNRLLSVASNPLVYANAVTAAENLLHAVGVPIAGANGFHEWWAQMIKDVGGFFSDLGGLVGTIWQNFIGNIKPGIEYTSGPVKIKV